MGRGRDGSVGVADLFSGLGGFSQGAAQAGATVVYASDHLALACKYHKLNHPGTRVVQQDLQQADMGDIGEPQLLVASPSCQGHSSNSRPARKGTGGNGHVDIERATERTQVQRATSWAVLAAAEIARPEVIVVENVPQILDWIMLPAWEQGLRACGYHLTKTVINAADYGSATDRRRAVIVAAQGGEIELAAEWGSGRRTMRDCLDLDYEGRFWAAIDSKPKRTRELIRKKQSEYGTMTGILANVGDGVRMRSFDDLAPTITTKTGTQLYHVDGDRCRIVNPRELARMQGLPDSYVIPEVRGDAALLIGNMITVEMAQGVVAQVLA